MKKTTKFAISLLASATLVGSMIATADAGSIYLTGHDVLVHFGQNGYDAVILDFLRGAGTTDEVAKASYTISVVGSGLGFAAFTDGPGFTFQMSGTTIPASGTLAGYGTATFYRTGTGADWNVITSADALVILSHRSCSACDLSDAGSAEVNANAATITAAFNAGMDIWGLAGTELLSYYDFLPPDAVVSSATISAPDGFFATTEGTNIGIVDPTPGVTSTTSMINGFFTHNTFPTFDPAFTVFERQFNPETGPVVSIGVQGATIEDGVIVPPPAVAPVPVDIKPQSCPNPINVKSRGVLPVAILGTTEFDVTQVDVTTVQLQGISPLRSALEDVATPFVPINDDTSDLDCTDQGPDGLTDLTLKFDTQAIVAALGEVEDGEELILTLTGELFDGTPIQGEDVVVIRKKGK